jgi:hypothetical protein
MVSRILRVADFAPITYQLRPQIAAAFAPRNQIEGSSSSARKRNRVLFSFVGAEPFHAVVALSLEWAFRVRRYLSFVQLCFHYLFSVVVALRSNHPLNRTPGKRAPVS